MTTQEFLAFLDGEAARHLRQARELKAEGERRALVAMCVRRARMFTRERVRYVRAVAV